jgi:hypothetical protein
VRALTHPAVVAFGLANLYLLALTGPLISSGHDLVYHLTGSASSVFIPVIVCDVVLTLLLTAVLVFAERSPRLRVVIWSGLVLALPLILLVTIAGFTGTPVPEWLIRVVGFGSLLAVVVIALLWKRLLAVFETAQHFVATMLGFFALSGVVIFAQLVWFGWQARDLNEARPLHRTQVVSGSSRQRVIWILLDELSQQQIYERRFSGLQLPAFDALAAQSTVFTQVVPTGEYTRVIIPSLLTGVPADHVRVSPSGFLLSTHDPDAHSWVSFDQHKTVFEDAIGAGYSTGVAGWYNPYCRILPEVLDRCFWTYQEAVPADLSPERPVMENLLVPIRSLVLRAKQFFGLAGDVPLDEAADLRMHGADYSDLLSVGDGMLADPSIDFLFLHMPVPHPFGFYDRRQQRMATRHTSYVDNLALADVYLAHVRELLERQHQWDSSTVIVMGDHSWRTSLIWESSESWTAEDAAASHGGEFDKRPAYIVKMPNQHESARVDTSFDAIHTKALLDAVMDKKVSTSDELRGWAQQQK